MRNFPRLVIVLATLLGTAIAGAQPIVDWYKYLDVNSAADIANATVMDASGNLFVAGQSGAIPNMDFLLTKYNSAGVVQWTKTLNKGGNPEAWYAITLHTTGGVVVAGQTAGNYYLARYNSDGSLAWEKSQDGDANTYTNVVDIPTSVCADSIGYVYLCGYSQNDTSDRIIVSKYSVNGIKQWAVVLGTPAKDDERAVEIVCDVSGVALCGQTKVNGNFDAWAVLLTLSGAIDWEKVFTDAPESEQASGIAIHPGSGDILVTGTAYKPLEVNPNSKTADVTTVRLNRDTGNSEWNSFYHNITSDFGYYVGTDNTGNIYIGAGSNQNSQRKMLIVKYSADGAQLYAKRLDDADPNAFYQPRDMFVDPAGGVTLLGDRSLVGVTNKTIQLFNVSPLGAPYDTGFDLLQGSDSPTGISGNFNGFVGVATSGQNGASNFDIATVMLRQTPIAIPDSYQLDEDVTLFVNAPGFRTNDFYTAGATAVKMSNPTKGVLTFNTSGGLTYVPNENATGLDTFSYQLQLGALVSATVNITLTIKPAPVAKPDFYTTPVDTPLEIAAPGVLANDIDVVGATAIKWTDPLHGTANLADDGSLTYTPNAGYQGPDSFEYKADRNQSRSNTTAKVSIYVGKCIPASLTLNPTTVAGGNNSTGKVTMTAQAPPGGAVVTLADNTSAITVPASVTVGAGFTSASFTVTTTAVSSSVTRFVSATREGITKTANLTINPAVLVSVVLSPSTVIGGQPTSGAVNLSGSAAGSGANVALSDNTTAISTPSNVLVPTNQKTVGFAVTTTFVASDVTRSVSAVYQGVARTANLLLKAGYAVVGLSMNPSTVKGGNPSTGTVTLNKAAGIGGISVALADNTGSINTPPSMTVASGSVSGTFGVTTLAVGATAVRKITATHNGTSKTADLILTP